VGELLLKSCLPEREPPAEEETQRRSDSLGISGVEFKCVCLNEKMKKGRGSIQMFKVEVEIPKGDNTLQTSCIQNQLKSKLDF